MLSENNIKFGIFPLYCFMLLVPSLIISGDGFLKALYPLIFFVALLYNYRSFFWLSLPFYCLSPFILYYEVIYDTPTDITIWLTILGSSATEAKAYFYSIEVLLALGLIAPYLLLAPVFYAKIPAQHLKLPLWLRILGLSLICSPIYRFTQADTSTLGYLSVYRHFKQSYPLNLVLGYPSAKLEVQQVKNYMAAQNNLQCSVTSSSSSAQTIVLVLGESARRDRLSLYGYTKNNTTPYLDEHKQELWLFDNMISGSFITSRSVPTLLTGQLENTNGLAPSFLNAFNAAKFKTYWFSAQSQFGEFDSLVSAYASSAQEKSFLTQHSYSASLATHYDGELLKRFDLALADPIQSKKLIVLHFYGSHAEFSKRYPAEFAKFNDQYDNTILYTDYLLEQIIQKLQHHGGASTMLYTADHGLNLGECQNNTSAHLDIKSNFDVPFIIWASSAWKTQHPDFVQRLTTQKNQAVSSINLMPTLLDMAQIKCQSVNNAQSLLNPNFKVESRFVLTLSDTVNYDQGKNDAECHLVNTDQMIK